MESLLNFHNISRGHVVALLQIIQDDLTVNLEI